MELVGLAEIAALFGTTKQVVSNWRTRKPGFPTAVVELKAGPVWSRDDIVKWAKREGVPLAEAKAATSAKESSGHNAISVAIMNMKGGVGKSTLSANLGWYTAHEQNRRVLMVDLDPQFNLSQYLLGVQEYEALLSENKFTVEALFRDSDNRPASVKDVIISVIDYDDGSCVHLIPASLELAFTIKNALQRAHVLRDFLSEVRGEYDLILIDCSPMESTLSTAAYFAADYIFVPVRPEYLSTIGLPLLVRSMHGFSQDHRNENVPELGGIIFNDTSGKSEHDKSRATVRQIALENNWYVFANELSHSDSYPAGARAGKPIFMTEKARSVKKEELNRVGEEFLRRIGL
jgi:chromosome partitioning protein